MPDKGPKVDDYCSSRKRYPGESLPCEQRNKIKNMIHFIGDGTRV